MLEVSTAFTCKAMVELVPALTLRDLEAQWRDLIERTLIRAEIDILERQERERPM